MAKPPPLRKKTILADKYELIAPAGVGGMATVWKANMLGAAGFRRTVAIKKMHRQFVKDSTYIKMFVEEARVGSQLVHQNVVQVYDFCGDESQGYFLVMEWVDGVSLKTLIESYTRDGQETPWDLVVYVISGVLKGLAAAHDRLDEDGHPSPVVHRDVTPGNILISVQGEAKLSDFGLARADDRDAEQTAPGIIKGKLAYAAPELLAGERATIACDIYGVGVCLWEALAGRRLFQGGNELEVLRQIANGRVPNLLEARPDLPAALCEVVHQTLRLEPEKRPSSAMDMAEELLKVLRRSRVRYFKDRLSEAVRRVRAEAA